MLVHGPEILSFKYLRNGPGIAAQPFHAERIEVALSVRGIDRIVDRVKGEGRCDLARMDSVQRRGSRQATKLECLKEHLRRVGCTGYVCVRKTVGDSHAGKREFTEWIARKYRGSFGILVIILLRRGVEAQLLVLENRQLLLLVVPELRIKNGEATRNGPVKQVRLGKAKQSTALDRAKLA